MTRPFAVFGPFRIKNMTRARLVINLNAHAVRSASRKGNCFQLVGQLLGNRQGIDWRDLPSGAEGGESAKRAESPKSSTKSTWVMWV
jgi:hypothetical protein